MALRPAVYNCSETGTRIILPAFKSLLNRITANDKNCIELDFTYLLFQTYILGSAGCILLAQALRKNNVVQRLVLRNQDIGDVGTKALADMLAVNHTIQDIDLYGNGITMAGIKPLSRSLRHHKSLTSLSLWSNPIGDVGAALLAQMLLRNEKLTQLGIVHAQINGPGGYALLKAMEVNTHVEVLNLASNRVPASILSQIRISVGRNRSHTSARIMDITQQIRTSNMKSMKKSHTLSTVDSESDVWSNVSMHEEPV